MRKIFGLTTVLITVLNFVAFLAAPPKLILDGKTNEPEWKTSRKYDLKNGGHVMVHKEGNEIWVALESDKKSWVQVYISIGDTIRVLHASAALGEAKYVKQNNLWSPVQNFKYELRDRIYNEEAEKKQQDYFRQFGWAANNNNMNDGKIFELRIDYLRFDKSKIAYLILDNPDNPHYFPQTLKDHTILPRLMQGYTPDSLSFDDTEWMKF